MYTVHCTVYRRTKLYILYKWNVYILLISPLHGFLSCPICRCHTMFVCSANESQVLFWRNILQLRPHRSGQLDISCVYYLDGASLLTFSWQTLCRSFNLYSSIFWLQSINLVLVLHINFWNTRYWKIISWFQNMRKVHKKSFPKIAS